MVYDVRVWQTVAISYEYLYYYYSYTITFEASKLSRQYYK